jgi:hypothetical protein
MASLEQIEMLSCRNKVHLELIMGSETLCLLDPSEYQNKSTFNVEKRFWSDAQAVAKSVLAFEIPK